LCIFSIAFAVSRARDFQSRSEVDLTASWRKADFVIPLLARVDFRLPNPSSPPPVITADLALPRHLTLTGGYLFADLRQRSQVVHVPLVAVTKSLHVGRLAIADRNRFEELVRFGTSPVRYRNGLLLIRQSSPTTGGLSSQTMKCFLISTLLDGIKIVFRPAVVHV
jgi:hypothetical protein